MQIAESVALVAGGTSGLGLATARRLVAAGARVVIVGRPGGRGPQVARELGDRAVFAAADITGEAELAGALDVAEALGPLRVVVNCAGATNAVKIVGKTGPYPLAEFQRMVTVNLVGAFNLLRLAADRMSRNAEVDGERGVVVHTASIAAFDGQVGQAGYAAAKSGLVGLTLPAARDLAPLKIRVVTVAPGVFDTPMLSALSAEAKSSVGDQVPHPARLGDPDEFAALALHIVANPMLNGETIRIDGAMRMGPR
ncbi:SDR family NAD(P)-dependent oxidoreductase [Kitasatospora sp. NPDC058032]|uniref:SDR family NAD(P)-dependent oxidoreductase n=1 Tax=unclassified Kitasatospora TaxID=2633591 RepID=UPI0033A732FF